MKTKLVLGAVAAAVAMFSQGAFAQAASAPTTRAEVKAEAKKGALAPAGEGPIAKQPSAKVSDKTRDERKATTKADAKSGAIKPAGESAEAKEDKMAKTKGPGTTDRDMRKADTKAAVKARTTQPAGEAPQPSAEKPKQ